MANFWDLPRAVRDTIYQLHLVEDDPISEQKHLHLAKHTIQPARSWRTKRMPSICAVSPKADSEASAIYYSENHFVFGKLKDQSESNVTRFMYATWPRHYRKIRKITIQWPKPTRIYGAWGGVAREAFLDIGRMSGLQELSVRVDEQEMVREMLWSRPARRQDLRGRSAPLTKQDNLALLRHPGMTGLLTLHDIHSVKFIKCFDWKGDEVGGPIPGGLFETDIAAKLRGPKKVSRQADTFPFLRLPAELRNKVYGMLLRVEGPLEPSPRDPSSAPKLCASNGHLPPPGSALNVLAVNRQVHDEAVGIFYHTNEFLFRSEPQLAAFIVTLGDLRLRSIRSITLRYNRGKSGGVELASIALPMLRRLTGLRALHILCDANMLARLHQRWNNGAMPYVFDSCDPNGLPGIRSLFNLRNIAEIEFRDISLDRELESLRTHRSFPDKFATDSRESALMRLGKIMKHFNAALADAQLGRLNMRLLADKKWPTLDEFPVIEEEVNDPGTETEAGEDEDGVDSANDAEDEMEDLVAPVMFDGIELSDVMADVRLRDRLRFSTRAARRTAEDKVEADVTGGQEVIRVSSEEGPKNGDSSASRATGDATKKAGSDPVDVEAAEEDEIDDEIVVKHRTKPGQSALNETAGATSRMTGIDGAEDGIDGNIKDEDEYEDESYWAREPSPEL